MNSNYIPDVVIDEIERLKEADKFEEAMQLVNKILQKNPTNNAALLQVADIQYRQGDLEKAAKAIDFLNSKTESKDPMGLYIKGVLEMEKNNWKDAKDYFKKGLEMTDSKSHEMLRCYGLSEYWYGNREKGLDALKDAFVLFKKDPELICNLVQIYLLEEKNKEAQKMIKYYYDHKDELLILNQSLAYYEQKIGMFGEYLKINSKF